MSALVSEQPTQTVSKPKAKVWRTQSQWKALLDNYESSGLTKTVFCQQNGIASSSLYKWQNYFADQAAKPDFIDITAPLAGAKPSQDTRYPDGDWQVELELGAGVILRVRVN